MGRISSEQVWYNWIIVTLTPRNIWFNGIGQKFACVHLSPYTIKSKWWELSVGLFFCSTWTPPVFEMSIEQLTSDTNFCCHDDVIKWKHFPRNWPLVRGIHRCIPSQRPVTRSFEVFFGMCLNKRLSKQSRCWWFETPSRSLWRQCNNLGVTTSYYTKMIKIKSLTNFILRQWG